jgi:hypothetical protein
MRRAGEEMAAEGKRGAWEGSDVVEEDLLRLRHQRRIPPSTEVECRAPGDEVEPAPRPGEVVVFYTHCTRGFGLPASPFFRAFCEFFGLQPHHLGANAVLALASFACYCEAYVGVWPTVDLWAKFFYLRVQKASLKGQEMAACGAASIYLWRNVGFPKIPLPDSTKKWQRTFFYARNVDPSDDRINLPAFANVVPTEKLNWSYDPKNLLLEVLSVAAHTRLLVNQKGLTGVDLVATFLGRRVLPLQGRSHKICFMSGVRDPTRTAPVGVTRTQLLKRVNSITKANLKDDWDFGLVAYNRERRPPVVSW